MAFTGVPAVKLPITGYVVPAPERIFALMPEAITALVAAAVVVALCAGVGVGVAPEELNGLVVPKELVQPELELEPELVPLVNALVPSRLGYTTLCVFLTYFVRI